MTLGLELRKYSIFDLIFGGSFPRVFILHSIRKFHYLNTPSHNLMNPPLYMLQKSEISMTFVSKWADYICAEAILYWIVGHPQMHQLKPIFLSPFCTNNFLSPEWWSLAVACLYVKLRTRYLSAPNIDLSVHEASWKIFFVYKQYKRKAWTINNMLLSLYKNPPPPFFLFTGHIFMHCNIAYHRKNKLSDPENKYAIHNLNSVMRSTVAAAAT